MFKTLFEENLYVKVSRNRFEIVKVSGDLAVEIVSSPEPFSTSRLLIGEFSLAEHLLANGINKVLPGKFFGSRPAVLMHPLEMTEGGLSEVEARVLREIALGAGARKVELWDGEELSSQQVVEKLENA